GEATTTRMTPFIQFLRYFLWLGTFGFGGPIASVGYMQRDLVEARGWLLKKDFLDGIALGQTMPGPLAAQVAMWVGYLRRGAVGAITAAEVALLFIAAGLLMIVLDAPPAFLRRRELLSLLIPLKHAAPTLGVAAAGTQLALFLFFLKAGAFIFGSGLAIVPFLREGVVNEHHWLTQSQFLDAVAVGLITPGPVVITATFIGYLVGGFVGALLATVAIFTPIYLGVVIPGRWFVRHRDHPRLQGFVKGATAAAAGAIGGATIVLTKSAVVDYRTALIALVALVLLWRFKLKEPYIVVLAALAGIALH